MRILVAEADAPLAEFLRQRLQQEQFAVHVVSNGKEAEQLASDPAYDLVLLDLNFDTMTNVVDVYINYLRRKVDSGHDRALIRTIRGVGYQIGGNGQHA